MPLPFRATVRDVPEYANVRVPLPGPAAVGVYLTSAEQLAPGAEVVVVEAAPLSLAATFPHLRELELEHGSVMRGLLARGGGTAAPPFASLRGGMGDLVATCTSEKSRNRTGGVALGQGRKLEDIVAEMKMVAEGVKSTEAVLELAGAHGVEMPIAEQVGAVLYEGRTPAEIVPALMLRQAKSELGRES